MCEKVTPIISFLNSQNYLFYASQGEQNARTFGLPVETIKNKFDLLLADCEKELQDNNLIKYVKKIKEEFNDLQRYKQAINIKINSIAVNNFTPKVHDVFTLPGISMLDLTYLPSFMHCTKLLEKILDKRISSVAKLVEAYIKLPDYDFLELENSFLEIYEFFKKIEIMKMLDKFQAGKLQHYLVDDVQALDETVTSTDNSDYDENDISGMVSSQALQQQNLEKQENLPEGKLVVESPQIKIPEILAKKIESIICEDNKVVPEHVVYFNYHYFVEQLLEILQAMPAQVDFYQEKFFNIVIAIHRSTLQSVHKYEQLNDILYDVLLFIFESMIKFLIFNQYHLKDFNEICQKLAEYFSPFLSVLELLNSPYNPFARAGLWGNRLNAVAENSKLRNEAYEALCEVKENKQGEIELPDIIEPSKNPPVYHYTKEEITSLFNWQARGAYDKTNAIKKKQLNDSTLSTVLKMVKLTKEEFITPLIYLDFILRQNLNDLFYWSIMIRGYFWAGTLVKLNDNISLRVPDGISKILYIIRDTEMNVNAKIFEFAQINFNLVGGDSQSGDTRKCYKLALGLKHQLKGVRRQQDNENDLAEEVLNEFIEQHQLHNLTYWGSRVRGLFWAGTLVTCGENVTWRVPNGIAKIINIINRTDVDTKAKINELSEVNYNLLGGRMQSEEARSCYKDAVGLKQQLVNVSTQLNPLVDKIEEVVLKLALA